MFLSGSIGYAGIDSAIQALDRTKIENWDLRIVFNVPVGRKGAVDGAALTPASDRTGNPSSIVIWISTTAIFVMPIAV